MEVASSEFESAEDAVTLCQALAQLQPGKIPNLARQAHAIARLFQQVPDHTSAAFRHLQQHGIPHLLRLFDQILGSDETDARDKLLLIAKTLARYETTAGADKIIEAARKPLNPEGPAWAGIFLQFKPEHPQRVRVFAALSEPLPDGFIAVALLDAANALRLAGDNHPHPFDSAAGKQRLQSWLQNTNPEYFSYAHSATAALPFLSDSGRAELFAIAEQHPDLGIRLEVAWARAKTGDAEGLNQLVGFCGHWSSAQTAQNYLSELGREDLIPAAAREPSFAALAGMSDWLAHPNELARIPDELEIVDHRELCWPPAREPKPFWLIRYRLRATDADESDSTGVGLVGSVTFCLFGYALDRFRVEDAYAVHCYWEMEQASLIEEEEVDDDSNDHQDLLTRWRAEPLAEARVVSVARLSEELDPKQSVWALVRAKRDGHAGFAVLGESTNEWINDENEDTGKLALKRIVGRQLLGLK